MAWSNHEFFWNDEEPHRFRRRGFKALQVPRPIEPIPASQRKTPLERCNGCKHYIDNWKAHWEASSNPECKACAAIHLWGTPQPPPPKSGPKGGRPRKIGPQPEQLGNTMILEIGKEYNFMGNPVKVIETQGDPPLYAVIEDRWASRATVSVDDLCERN